MRLGFRALLCMVGFAPSVVASPALGAQGAVPGAPVREAPPPIVSLGQPRLWGWIGGAAAGVQGSAVTPADALQLRLGAYSSIANPVVDALGVSLEGYVGQREQRAVPGLRARLAIPIYGLAVGADHDLDRRETDLILSLRAPLRRGGILGRGSMLRVDYLPTRGRQLYAGIELPLVSAMRSGRARPLHDAARLRAGVGAAHDRVIAPPDAEAPLRAARVAADDIRAQVLPFLGRRIPTAQVNRTPLAPLPVFGDAVQRYHDAIDAAFGAALRTGPDAELGGLARDVLLDDVLLPYNRLLGQRRDPETTRPLADRARATFRRHLTAEFPLPPEAAMAAAGVFDAILDIVESQRAATVAVWREGRFAWLPLQLALRPEQHDTHEELDALIARAVERPFSDGNFVSYVINEQFQYQVSRTIHAAEEYHVLWTHDFRGVDDVGNPDEMAYRQVVRSYLAAMTARVRAYDSTGTFPTYMILHDQWYYSVRKGRFFLRFLENPTRMRLRFPPEYAAWGDTIAAAQEELRRAIAGSQRLQEARRRYGDEWVRNLVRVHVSVMNRPDPAFRSWRLVRGLPMTDNILRDHRKLVFYDISEDDPYRGEALFTGAGIGEHYSNLTWEDRSLLVRGPALLNLKDEARRNLMAHRIPEARLPPALRVRPKSAAYDARVAATIAGSERSLRALSIHNETGYDSKDVNVAKAILYTMMPTGSVILVPDSFWNAEFWGSALFGAALRGARVLLIAPSNGSNSVEVRGTQLLSRELLWRLLVARDRHAQTLAANGGVLGIGIFDTDVPVTDIPGKVHAVRETFEREEWLRTLFGFPAEAYAALARLDEELGRLAMAPVPMPEFEHDARTRLHLKANFFASREAWGLMQRPEWGALTWSFVSQRIAQVQGRRESVIRLEEAPDALLDVGSGFVADWRASLPAAERERVVFYTMMGSQNQNYRSMVMDAEVAFLVADWPSVIPYLDAIALVGQSHWLAAPDDLHAHLPPLGTFVSLMAHWGRLAF